MDKLTIEPSEKLKKECVYKLVLDKIQKVNQAFRAIAKSIKLEHIYDNDEFF